MVGQLKLIGTKTNLIISSTAVFLSCFVLSFVASSLIIQPQGTKAITGLHLAPTPTITLTSNTSAITQPLTPSTTNGGRASISHTLTASTNVPTGYNLTLATTTPPTLPTTTGTLTSPTTLADNTWGYALPKVASSSPANTITNGFDTNYTTPTPTAASKWANPTTPTIIKNTSTTATNNSTTVYYGLKANMSLRAGTYTNTIRYTATANTTNIPNPSITSVNPATGTTAGGTNIQITGTGFTVNDQSVTTAVTIDNQACQNVTISSNTPTTGQDTIYCTTPAHPTAGAVSIAVTTWKSTATRTSAYTYIAPTATITTPTQNQILAAGTTSTTLTVTTNIPATCYYGTATNPTTTMTTTGNRTTHTQTITGLTNASTNTRHVRCQVASGHSYGNNVSRVFYVKAAAPTLGTINPIYGTVFAAGTTSTTLSTTTNQNAICYYGGGADPTTQMAITGGTSHSQSIGGLSNSGGYVYYIRCISSSGNTISDYGGNFGTIFYVKTATPATPALYPASGAVVNTGATSVVVDSSGASCIWGESYGSYPYGSWTTRNTTVGTNTLYYYCIAGSGATQSDPIAGSWSYTGQMPKIYMQNINTANCPTTRTRVNDYRDDATYWIQKLADGRCWMLTNLAYGGGGDNTHGDAKAIINNNTYDYQPYYMIPPGSNRTAGTTDPSTSTNGTGQYGYLYNWCAATGVQTNTSACANRTSPPPNASISICPSGWRLPTGNIGGEFQQLASAVGAISNGSGGGSIASTNLRNNWLTMYSGYLYATGSFGNQGGLGTYWSTTQYIYDDRVEYYTLNSGNSTVSPISHGDKRYGRAVRCIAA